MLLKDFPLAWRWMNEKYALLPEHVLFRIHPQSKEQAAQLFRKSLEFCGSDGLDEKQFLLSQIETNEVLPLDISDWLFSHHQNQETQVILSWQPDLAVKTTWGIFVKYWTEFCYPASDDLIVWSELYTWVLLYHHEEQLQFGERV